MPSKAKSKPTAQPQPKAAATTPVKQEKNRKRKADSPAAPVPAPATTVEKPAKKAKVANTPKIKQQIADAPPVESVMKMEEESFPRGGASALTPLEYREVADQAKHDFLFEQTTEESQPQPQKKKRRRQEATTTTDGPTKSKKTRNTVHADPLSFKRVSVGTTFLGTIKEINDLDLAVALPNQLTGYISITEISEAISAQVEKAANDEDDEENDAEVPELRGLFYLGQPVVCVVISVEDGKDGEGGKGKKRIELSLKPELVNVGITDVFVGLVFPAVITSQEDHGYIVSCGFESMTGFLHNKAAEKYIAEHNGGRPLSVGQVVICSVSKVDEGRKTLNVTIDPETVAKAVIPTSQAPTMDSLKAGGTVNAKIHSVVENGLVLSFLGVFEGTVDWFHLGHAVKNADTDLFDKYKDGQKVRARILYVDPTRKKIGLTLAPHLLGLKSFEFPAEKVEIGTVVEKATVLRVDSVTGLLLDIPGVGLGYVHISKLADERVEKIDKKFKAGTSHRARVIGFDSCDGLVIVTFEQSVISRPFMRYEDIKVGSIVKGEILKLESFGMLVALTPTIKALCPTRHLSDVTLQKPERMFKPSTQIKCQVLSSDPSKKRLILTHKKSLMTSTVPPITSYSGVTPGQVAMGVVQSLKEFGAIVTFYNDVKALLPVSEVREEFVKSVGDVLKVGQVVKCRVLTVEAGEEKMRVSLKLSRSSGGGADGDVKEDVKIGQLVSGKVLSVAGEGVLVEVLPNGGQAFLPKAHLSDHVGLVEKILGVFKEGSVLEGLVVVAKEEKKGRVVVSRKGLMVAEAKKREGKALDVKELTEGQIVPGYVKAITDVGAFVMLAGGVVGLVKVQNVSDGFVSKVSDHLKLEQSVLAYVSSFSDDGKVGLSLKQSQLITAEGFAKFETAYLKSYFAEQDLVYFQASKKAAKKAWVSSFEIGAVVKGKVTKVLPYGTIVELSEGVSGLITKGAAKTEVKIGEEVKCKVLDVDVEKKIVDLMVVREGMETTLANGDQKVLDKFKKAQEKSSNMEGVVEVVKEAYSILTVASNSHAVAYVLSTNINSTGTAFTKFKVGQTVQVTVTQAPQPADATKAGLSNQRAIGVAVAKKVQTEALLTSKRTVKDAVDSEVSSLEDFTPGRIVKGRIQSVKEGQVNIVLGANLKGRVHITEIVDRLEDLPDPKHPFKGFKVGDVHKFKVIGFHDAKSHAFLPFTHNNPVSKVVVELTVRPEEMALPQNELTKRGKEVVRIEGLRVGDKHLGFVQSTTEDAVWIHLSTHALGRLSVFELPVDLMDVSDLESRFPSGLAVEVYVLRVNAEKKALDLTMKSRPEKLELKTLEEGKVLVGRVTKVNAEQGLVVQLGPQIYGRVHLTDLRDGYLKQPTEGFEKGDVVRCCVLSVDIANKQVDLSLRASRVGEAPATAAKVKKGKKKEVDETPSAPAVAAPEVKDIKDLEADTVVVGYIRNISEKGCFVSLNRNVAARVQISELSDAFIKDWKTAFRKGQLVKGRVLSVDQEKGQVELSLKNSVVDPSSVGDKITFADLAPGKKVKGTIKKIESFGVFIQLQNSSISGLCHASELSDTFVDPTKIEKLYSVGDSVKAVVLRVSPEKKKVSLGLKASYFDDEDAEEGGEDSDVEMGEVGEEEDEEEGVESMDVDGEEEEEGDEEDGVEEGGDQDDDDEDEDEDGEEGIDFVEEGDSEDDSYGGLVLNMADSSDEENGDEEDEEDLEALDIGDFSWDGESKPADGEEGGSDAGSSDEEQSDADEKTTKKKSRRAKQRAKREEEERIAQKEMSLLDGDQAPEVADDFERLLLGSPNSSYLWIKFMAFQLQMAEVEKARAVAERALKTISFREEQEKMNVWVALMNLENTYGTQESLLKVFERAVTMNEPKAVHMQLVRIYQRTQKLDLAEQLFQSMTKRFKESSKVWTNFGLFQLKRGKVDEARKILQRSLQSLAKRKHVKTICKFAQMEFKYGEPERGRTIFEGIMSNYPKRVDLWSIYLDMEIRNGDVDITRRLFERVIKLKLSSKKMKFFFKKYLDFEKSKGTAQGVEHVKQAAVAYVEGLQRE
ncbi:Protein RRP5 [Rhizophlyctis rosea]|uniref:Protein RRP5 n=1 Tax=Rhizophlyctis rosea TaxID=64517 RepID=A0AAD5X9P6_9FUNG|nr:Protein RRP5 [Rhizophlyctis rosea]